MGVILHAELEPVLSGSENAGKAVSVGKVVDALHSIEHRTANPGDPLADGARSQDLGDRLEALALPSLLGEPHGIGGVAGGDHPSQGGDVLAGHTRWAWSGSSRALPQSA